MNTRDKLLRNPFGLLRRAIYKTTVARWKYGRGGGYDARRYWHDRLGKYGESLVGVGDEGLSEHDNRRMYEQAAQVFRQLCSTLDVDWATARVLEIGVGTGYYAELLHSLGVRSYTGIDITDANFPAIRAHFPAATLTCADITEVAPDGTYDVIVMVDVIEHIVEDERFDAAMTHIADALEPGGHFVLTPINEQPRRNLFYVRTWSRAEIAARLPGFTFGELRPFRTSAIAALRKPPS